MVMLSDEMMVDPQLTEDVNRLHVSSVEESDDEPLLLATVKDPEDTWSLTRQYFPSKAGGAPAWLDPIHIPTGRSSMCDICGMPLQFLLQVYAAPLDKESSFHRALFVFVCTKLSCLIQHLRAQQNCYHNKKSRSVKVFRCQLPRVNPFYSYDPPNPDGTAEPLCPGAVLCDWCATWKGDGEGSSSRISYYCSDIHRSECRRSISLLSEESGSVNSKDVQMNGEEAVASKLLWPEKEIILKQVEHSRSNKDSSQNKVDIVSYVPDDGLDDHLTEAFMDEVERRHALVSLGLTLLQGGDNNKSWAAFEERVREAPDQVLRYWRSLEAKPLWPLATDQPSESEIPKCNHCGGELCFEFQIMPQLLYFLKVKNDDDYMDWGTIAVYTCKASCDEGPSYKDEFAWVQPSFQHAMELRSAPT